MGIYLAGAAQLPAQHCGPLALENERRRQNEGPKPGPLFWPC